MPDLDYETPAPLNKIPNIWSELLGRHRGYTYSARVLSRTLGLFRNATIQKRNPSEMQCYQKAMQILFAAEKENSYNTIKSRRGTPSFPIVEEKNILFLCGRKMAEEHTNEEPSIHKQDNHYLLKDAQESKYMVPVLRPHSTLGLAVAQELHDQTCGSSPATAMARATRYFHFCPSAGNLFRNLQNSSFKCRRIRMIRGRDLINPLRHLSHTSMMPGLSLQIDVAGPWLVFTKSKQSTQETRQERRAKRTTTKMWLLLAIDYFT